MSGLRDESCANGNSFGSVSIWEYFTELWLEAYTLCDSQRMCSELRSFIKRYNLIELFNYKSSVRS